VLNELDKDIFSDVVNFGTRSSHMPRFKKGMDIEEFAEGTIEVVKMKVSPRIKNFKQELAEFQ